MVITNQTEIQDFKYLEVKQDVNVTTATLMAAAPYLGAKCEAVNNEFMLCRTENMDPRPCTEIGKKVTECTVKFFKQVKEHCSEEFTQYAFCIDKSSGNFAPWVCRKTQHVLTTCMKQNLCLDVPHFGYFTRARIHKTQCSKPKPICPCPDPEQEFLRYLPDDFPRHEPRFSSRLYWMTE